LSTLLTDVTQNADDESLATSKAGQPRGDCPYLKNLDSVGAIPRASPKPMLSQGFYLRKVSYLCLGWGNCLAEITLIARGGLQRKQEI
jgi:hypothetical protein